MGPTEKLTPIWRVSEARNLVQGAIDRKVFDVSRTVFVLSLVVAAITGWPR